MVEAMLPTDRGAEASEGSRDPVASGFQGPGEGARLRQVLHLHSGINRALLEATGEADLLDRVCESVLDVGGYRLVWIGEVGRDPERRIRPLAQAGFEDGYLDSARITWADEPEGQGPSGRAARTGEPHSAQDIREDPTFEPWREDAMARGYASSAAIPVPIDGRTELLLNLYAQDAGAFSDTELELLEDVGLDLGRGLAALREKEARRTAEAEARRLGHAFERASWGMAMSKVDTDRFEHVNDAFAEMLGYEPGELLDRSVADLFTDAGWHRIQPAIQEALDQGETVFEETLVRKDGSTFPARVHLTVVQDEEGASPYRVATVEDITDQREAQAELESRAKALARTNTELERFAFIASHDLKEPVRTINSFSQLLERQAADDLDQVSKESLRFILEAAQRLYQLIQDLLEYSSGRHRPLSLERIDLDDLVDRVQVRLRETIAETQAAILVEDLPVVRADRIALGQAIEQLLDNALQYSGDKPPLVHIWAEEHPDSWELVVRDEGIGISEKDQEGIFEIFSRRERKTATSGTGMGLAIVRSAVDRHGGEVWVDSEAGHGSAFHIRLPAEPDEVDPTAPTDG